MSVKLCLSGTHKLLLTTQQVPAGCAAAEALLHEAGLTLPCLAKPLAACGVPYAHRMAILTQPQGLDASRGWDVPHILQQWVPHTGCLHKVYVLGCKVGPSVLQLSLDLASAS